MKAASPLSIGRPCSQQLTRISSPKARTLTTKSASCLETARGVAVRRAPGIWLMVLALVVLSSAHSAAAQAAIEYGHIATSSSVGLTGLSNKINSTLSPDKKTVSVVTPDKQSGPVTDTAS